MTPSPDDAPPESMPDEGWDDAVLVWNATVARIPPPTARPDPARDPAPDLERD